MLESLSEILSSPILKSSDITRYSSHYQTRPENLSEHVHEVMTMSYIIGLNLKSLGEYVNLGLLLEKGLFHDSGEVFTGDIVRSTKYYNDRVHKELKFVEDDILKKYCEAHDLSRIYDLSDTSKMGKEGLIIKLVDMLSVVKKCQQEVELLGNNTFLGIMIDLPAYLDEVADKVRCSDDFTLEGSRYLIDLCHDAKSQIETTLSNNSQIIEKYNLTDTSVYQFR